MIAEMAMNGLRRETAQLDGFPLEVFPQKVQSIVLDWHAQDDYRPEFSASAMLSAASTAIGNSYHIHIRGGWINNPSLFMVLVGPPSLGKTPPLQAAFAPIQRLDIESIARYCKAREEGVEKKPVLAQVILDDFTPEAMIKVHSDNPKGVVVKVDEFMGMINTVNRYNSSNLIELLLTAFSGAALKKVRVSDDKPCYVTKPCVNLIGTIQTRRVPELLTKGLDNNGFLARLLFVYPKNRKVALWDLDEVSFPYTSSPAERWEGIVRKLLEQGYDQDSTPTVLKFSDEARRRFYSWRNELVNTLNENPDMEDCRMPKRVQIAAHLALTMQLLRWACAESHKEHIDLQSVEAAIALSEYYEDCYDRLMEDLGEDALALTRNERFLHDLPEQFTTAQAIEVGKKYSLKANSVKKLLRKLLDEGLLKSEKKGHYTQSTFSTSSTSEAEQVAQVDKVDEVPSESTDELAAC
ncbi:MAG: DUF3987 domain-containing protein [Bacteroidales bacterium]|nr:DUF3987 domain-containing protein [Bacteroidales bacterium]MCD8394249.1 DUF3987 domain-containing protein [Bacteroidales bacterium]